MKPTDGTSRFGTRNINVEESIDTADRWFRFHLGEVSTLFFKIKNSKIFVIVLHFGIADAPLGNQSKEIKKSLFPRLKCSLYICAGETENSSCYVHFFSLNM